MEDIINKDILDLEYLFDDCDKSNATYTYNGNYVPRVSHILKFCENQEPLIEWAASIPKTMFDNIRNKATEVGTITHQYIEDFLRDKLGIPLRDHPSNPFIPTTYYNQAKFAFNNFLNWYTNFKNSGYNIEQLLGSEYTVVTPYYGGTIDAIVTINGRNYIIDFKTSKAITYSYLIQTAAYRYAINNYYQDKFPHIHGIGIIRVSKTNANEAESIFVDEMRDNAYLNNLEYCFGSYVESYYRGNSIMNTFTVYRQDKFSTTYGEYING